MRNHITFGSVCSGIEAASVAWHPLGWRAAWLSEIEANPSTILAHHYPDVPNLGDMTHIPQLLRNGDIPPPDVFCGGTPCQAFSVAGLRNSLGDARGNLSLKFCDIANEIDIQRAAAGLLPCTVFWENVPGVLSTKDNAFGCFLGQLAGEDCALVPSGDKWSDAGAVLGPQRAIAWRVLDAQFFGLAQRRKRVFVVASARNGFDPAAVLFEFEGVRRDSAPRRSTGQEAAAGTLRSTDGGCDVDHARAGHILAFGGNNQAGPIDVATARNACASASGRMDFESETFVVQPALSVALRGREGGGTAELGDDLANCLRASTGGGDKPHVLAPVQQYQHHCPCGRSFFGSMAASCPACGGGNSIVEGDARDVLEPIAFDARQDCVSSTEVFGALGSSSPQAQAVAFSCKDYGADVTVELAPTMRAMGHSGSHANAGGQLAVCVTGDITHTLKAEGFDASEDGTGRGQPIVAAFQSSQSGVRISDVHATLDANNGPRRHNGAFGMAVRRLTPRECERLQGFPGDYTLVPMPDRRKVSADGRRAAPRMMADGPRYKALGNSWAVPVVRWIGHRIDTQLRSLNARAA